MTIGQMFEQSGMLALLGMGTVFAFLIILIVCITLVGKIIQGMGFADEEPAKPKPVKPVGNDAAVTAAITAAVTEYRATH
ncbi:MAG: OadG family protein [Treponema sp.]|jgi:oxaloacetate decarboxylase gamma subunit|nr:OadG family protein [Treponema sp.]